ncbi:MAG: spermidine/putrescine transport system permease protein [Mycobacterium sp.]|nr:spermidine/putrescine transport system permease protein [Mycobacterium sp.]
MSASGTTRSRLQNKASQARVPRSFRGWALATPPMLFTLVFFVAPLALLVLYSFGQMDILTFQISFGWTTENWRTVFTGIYASALLRSVALSVVSTALCVLIAFPAALGMTRMPARMQNVLLLAVIVPYWISFVVRNYAWLTLLGPEGMVTRCLEAVHVVDAGKDLRYTSTAIVIGMVSSYLPLMILPIYVALERIDPAVLDAAADLGLHGVHAFRRVVLPLSAPGLIAGVLLVGVPATGEYTIPAILGGGKTLMVGNVIRDKFLGVGDFPLGSALAATLMGLLIVVLVASRKRIRQLEDVL